MQVGSQFGLIGVLLTSAATSGQKADIRAHVAFTNITLRTASSTNVVWQSSIDITTNFVADFAAANEQVIFSHPDNCLKTVVTELTRQLAAALQTNTVTIPPPLPASAPTSPTNSTPNPPPPTIAPDPPAALRP